jgi:hypothetical protein
LPDRNAPNNENTDTFDDVTLTISELPDGCTAGVDCYLVFVVDDYREVSESNETDNQTAIKVAIIDPNAPPVANDQSVTTSEDTPVSFTLDVSDPDGDVLTYSYVGPSHGTLTGTEPNLTYTPSPNFNGTDSFTYTASDGEYSVTATVTITVAAVTDFTFEGFFNPWTETPAYQANAGSAIPLKWRYRSVVTGLVVDSSTFDPTIKSTYYQKSGATCQDYVEGQGTTTTITTDPDDTGSSDRRYSASSAEWQLNWATPETTGCYYLRVFNNLEGLGGEVSEPLLIILK